MQFTKLVRPRAFRRRRQKILSFFQRGVATEVEIRQGKNDSVQVFFGNQELHPLWLRERCTSPESVQESTKQPLHEYYSLPLDLNVTRASIVGNTTLNVTFSDGLTSTYYVKNLRNEIHDIQSETIQFKNNNFPTPVVTIGKTAEPKRINFSSLFAGAPCRTKISTDYVSNNVVVNLINALFEDGHVIVSDVPCYSGAVVDLGRSLTRFNQVRPTNWGDYFNVQSKADGDKHDIAYTSLALPPHVDNPYRDPPPCFQLLHALANDCSGGESIAVDAFSAAKELENVYPDFYDALCQTGVRWENDGGSGDSGMYTVAPMIDLEKNSDRSRIKQIRYSAKSGGYVPWMSYEESQVYFEARHQFSKMLNEKHRQCHFRLQTGDVWIFNNLRLLHGRTEFEVDGERHLQGCYVDVDGFQYSYFKAINALARQDIQ